MPMLYDFMAVDPSKRSLIDWEIRYQIIVGIARGVLYLHQDSQLRVIHRDLKASNILLDDQMNAKYNLGFWHGKAISNGSNARCYK
jgi:serine/threonine protein kinase